MSRLAELREERAVFARRAQELNSQYAADQRMPQDAAEKLDAMIARIEQIDGEISNLSHRAEAAGQEITDRVQGGMRTPKEFRAHYLRNGAPRKEERAKKAKGCGVGEQVTIH